MNPQEEAVELEDIVGDIYLGAIALKSTDFMIRGHLKSCLRVWGGGSISQNYPSLLGTQV